MERAKVRFQDLPYLLKDDNVQQTREMWNIKFIIPVLVVIFSRFSRSLALECVKIDRCSCKFDDGSGTVNLTQLGKETGLPL